MCSVKAYCKFKKHKNHTYDVQRSIYIYVYKSIKVNWKDIH